MPSFPKFTASIWTVFVLVYDYCGLMEICDSLSLSLSLSLSCDFCIHIHKVLYTSENDCFCSIYKYEVPPSVHRKVNKQ